MMGTTVVKQLSSTSCQGIYKKYVVTLTAICLSVNVLDFKYRTVKIYLLKIWLEFQTLIKKFQALIRI